MIYAAPGQTDTAFLTDAPTGLVGTLGFSIVDSAGASFVARSTAGITEIAAGQYAREFTAPAAAGVYLIVWDNGPLTVGEELTIGWSLPQSTEPAEWIPTLADVAHVVPAYTRGGFDDEDAGEYPGEEHGTFTSSTSPTATEVDALIGAAADEVRGRVGRSIPDVETLKGLARSAVVWHVAADIAGTKMSAGSDDARGEYSKNIANYRNTLDALIVECRRGPIRLV